VCEGGERRSGGEVVKVVSTMHAIIFETEEIMFYG
jgi:hypothetical protein